MRRHAALAGLDLAIDSAGTGAWHVGNGPDPRAQAEALRHGIDISGYRARQVTEADFARFDHIIALDRSNFANLEKLVPQSPHARLSLLLDHVTGLEGRDVDDPYFGGAEGFIVTWDQVDAAARNLVAAIVG